MRHGGKILIDQLEAQGATTAFTVPGESFLAALDGLHDSNRVRTIVCRQEGGAAMMAEAWGKLTGEPGLCFATRGPGAANAMAGLHVAQQDSTPMILLLGLPGSGHEDREAFQEIDTKRLFSSFVKWAAVIRDTERIPEYVSRAYHVARSGRPGPVVLGLPEDMLARQIDVADARPARSPLETASPEGMAALVRALGAAERPLMIIGGPGWSEEIAHDLTAFADRFNLPTLVAFRYQDFIDNRNRCYAGHAGVGMDPKVAAAIREADLLLVVGARLGECTTQGYELVEVPNPRQTLVHVHPDPDELGSVYRADVPIVATARAFATAVRTLDPGGLPTWGSWRAARRAAYEEFALTPVATPGAVRFAEAVRHISNVLPEDAIVTNGAGNYAAFLHRYFVYKRWRTQLAPTSGSMGYGLPAAIAAKLAHPDRTVINFAGDGCFMMTGQELATAVQYHLPIVTVIADNGMYGTIRMHQERTYPGRVSGTALVNPDFAAYARAFGAHGETVVEQAELSGALDRALASGKPSILHLKLDPEALTPRQTLSQIRAASG